MRNCFRSGKTAVFFWIALIAFIPALSAQQAVGYRQVTGLIHMDSSISGGKNTPEMLAAIARSSGASFGILTDHDTQKVTYGFRPLENVLKVSYTRGSIRTHGASRYLNDIAGINRTMGDFVLIPGIEAVPYYHWEKGKDGRLQLRDLHRHLLVMGLETPEKIENLPSIEAGYPSRYTGDSLKGLFWLAPFILALVVMTRPRGGIVNGQGMTGASRSLPMRAAAALLFLYSLLMLVNGYPFQMRPVDQYQPDMKRVPYQAVIDYVNNQGGLTFWAHPEAAYKETIDAKDGNRLVAFLLRTFLGGGLTIETAPYPALLNDTRNYTGFSIFSEGFRTVGSPGGLWDDLLMQFCAGKRDRPVWAISELDLDSDSTPEAASESQTVVLVRGEGRREYLDALRVGRMYCFTHNITRVLTIQEYSAVSGDVRAISGEILPFRKEARMILDLRKRGAPSDMEVLLIRDGSVIRRERFTDSERFEVPLVPIEGDKSYIRVVIMRSGEMVAATNPIFLRRAGRS